MLAMESELKTILQLGLMRLLILLSSKKTKFMSLELNCLGGSETEYSCFGGATIIGLTNLEN